MAPLGRVFPQSLTGLLRQVIGSGERVHISICGRKTPRNASRIPHSQLDVARARESGTGVNGFPLQEGAASLVRNPFSGSTRKNGGDWVSGFFRVLRLSLQAGRFPPGPSRVGSHPPRGSLPVRPVLLQTG